MIFPYLSAKTSTCALRTEVPASIICHSLQWSGRPPYPWRLGNLSCTPTNLSSCLWQTYSFRNLNFFKLIVSALFITQIIFALNEVTSFCILESFYLNCHFFPKTSLLLLRFADLTNKDSLLYCFFGFNRHILFVLGALDFNIFSHWF